MFENLLNISDGNEDVLNHLIDIYIRYSNTCSQQLQQAVVAEDWQRIIEATHGLKGASLNLGVDKIAKLAQEIETQIKNHNLSQTTDLITRLHEQLHEAQSLLVQLKQAKP